MLTAEHSNRLEIPAEQFAAVVRHPGEAPFVPEILLVQHRGLARWLALRLVDQLGVCAHVRYQFPAAFIWELCQQVLTDVPATSPFAPDVLTWRLMALFGDVDEAPRCAPLLAYCTDGDVVKRYALAARLATVYDQYLVYRPAWIRAWEAGAQDHWQASPARP